MQAQAQHAQAQQAQHVLVQQQAQAQRAASLGLMPLSGGAPLPGC